MTPPVRILGLVFAGTATDRRGAMTGLLAEVLGLERVAVEGADADMFRLPDGSTFAVAGPRAAGETSRTIGFEVEALDDAVTALRAAGVDVDDPAANDAFRYAHFRAPDGHLYELVERRP